MENKKITHGVSVIVPVYNTEYFLDACLSSIRNQKYNNIEIIIINDGSNDNSSTIIKMHSKIDKRIKVFETEGIGAGAARNIGIKKARYSYITFVDSDDIIEQNMISDFIEAAIKYNKSLIIGNYRRINEDRRIESLENKFEDLSKNEFIRKLIRFEIASVMWRILYKRETFIKNNLFFHQDDIYNEDSHLLYRIIDHSSNIKFINGIHYNWLQRNGSKTNSISKKHIKDITFVLLSMWQYVKNRNLKYINQNDFTMGAYLSLTYRFKKIEKPIKLLKFNSILPFINGESISFIKSNTPHIYWEAIFALKNNYNENDIINTGLFEKKDIELMRHFSGEKIDLLVKTLSIIKKRHGNNIYIYGAGNIFDEISSHLSEFNIKGIIDKNIKEKNGINFKIGAKDILEDGCTILIASYAFSKEISDEILEYSFINKKKFFIYDYLEAINEYH